MITDRAETISSAIERLNGTPTPANIDAFIDSLSSGAMSLAGASIAEAVADTRGARQVMASGLALMLYVWNDSLDDLEISRQAQIAFDASFQQLYKSKQIDRGAQTHEKRRVIIESLSELFSEFERLRDARLSVEHFTSFRERYLRVYNSERAKLLLNPLLPTELQGDLRINAALRSIWRFLSETGTERRQAASQALEMIEEVRDVLITASPRLQSKIFTPLTEMFDRFRNLWDNDPANLQASIVLEPSLRLYPLKQLGRRIEINLVVKNEGPGVAWDVLLKYYTDLAYVEKVAYIGTLEPGTVIADLPETVEEARTSASVACTVTWTDSDGPHTTESDFEIACQRDDTDWDTLARRSPYSTEPVFKEHQFFGRHEQVGSLIRKLSQEQMPSFYVVGQKRVGKTSFVQRIEEVMRSKPELRTETIFVSPENFIASSATETVARLSNYLAIELRNRFTSLRLPLVDARELQDLTTLFESIGRAGHRVIIAIDEFDEIQAELYDERSQLSGPFFLALRGLSSQPHISFIIVGSEKLELIMQEQGQRLNKWSPEKLDYFSKETSWTDYRDLVTKPVENQVDFGDDAVNRLHEITAGHPYFSKQICQRVLDTACRDRFSWVGRQNIESAFDELVEQLDSGPFQHFWKDGLVGTPEQQEQHRYLRQCLFLAMADLSRKQDVLSFESVLHHQSVADIAASARGELSQFFTRRILKGDYSAFEFRVRFFERWLSHKGTEQIISTMRDPSAIIARLRASADLAIRSDELVAVSRHWVYKGHRISTDEIRRWLEQFGGVEEQRLVFNILKDLRFITADAFESRFKEFASEIQRRLPTLLSAKARKRGDMLISYFGSPGKSGADLARRFADASRILTESVVERGKLRSKLESDDPISALIFVDDIVGTGRSACDGVEALASECGDRIRERGCFLFYIAVVATTEGRDRLLQVGQDKFGSKFELLTVTVIGSEAKVFSDSSTTFQDDRERERTRELVAKFGQVLEPSHPLGFEDGQLAVVFESSCPNNSLPVLWKDKGTWSPLFRRHGT